MPRRFNSDYMGFATGLQRPLSVSLWFRAASMSTTTTLWGLGDTGYTDRHYMISLSSTSPNKIWIRSRSGTSITTNAADGINGDTTNWHHVLARWSTVAAGWQEVWLDGANDASSSTTVDPTITNMRIGVEVDNSPASYFDGDIAHVAIWNTATFPAGDIAAIAAGASPLLVQPQYLWGYWPIWNNNYLVDLVGGNTLTETGSTGTSTTEPRVWVPVLSTWFIGGSTPAGLSISVTDSVTVGESSSADVIHDIVETDMVTVAELLSVAVPYEVSESDAVSLGESTSLSIGMDVSETDAITLGEATTLDIAIDIAETDSVSIGEVTTVSPPTASLTVSETDSVTLGETVDLAIEVNASVSDAVTMGEAVSAGVTSASDLTIAASDAVSVSEIVHAIVPGRILMRWIPAIYEPPSTNHATLGMRNGHRILNFDDTTDESAHFTGILPQAYSGSGLIIYIHYAMASAASGTVGWNVSFERIGDQQQDIDSDSFATAQSNSANVPTSSGLVDVLPVGFSSGAQMDSVATGEVFRLKVTRDAANDTATGDGSIVMVELRDVTL